MRASLLRPVLLAALLYVGIAYAQSGICPPSQNIGNLIGIGAAAILPIAIALSLLALLVSIMIIGIIYIITKLLPGVGLARWLQDEYKEIVKSAILIMVIFSVISIMSGISIALMGTTTSSYGANVSQLYYQSEVYICSVNTQLNTSMQNMFDLELVSGFASDVHVYWQGIPFPPALSYAIPVVGEFLADLPVFYSGFGAVPFNNNVLKYGSSAQYSSLFNDMVNFVEFPMITVYSSQRFLLPLFMVVGLLLLLPVGLIFRSIPLIRGIGGTILALGIGLAVVWPSVLVLFNAPMSSYFSSVFPTQIQQQSLGNACNSWGILSSVCNSISSGAEFASGLAESTAVVFQSMSSIYPALNYLLYYNLFLIFQFYFLFVFDLIITYSIIDNIARLLGGSIRLSFGRRLKLI